VRGESVGTLTNGTHFSMSTDYPAPCHWLQLWFSRVGTASLSIEVQAREWLSPAEHKRLQRIRPERKRREYLLSRALMRHALSRQFSRAESSWQFSQQLASPPLVGDLPADTFLSLSHSGGYVCFAIANCAVGVDIELVKPQRDRLAAARVFMDDSECAMLARRGAGRAEYFYRSWCAKEACYKALSPSAQAETSMRSISYPELQRTLGGWQLLEGDGIEFRFAAVLVPGPLRVAQHGFPESMEINLDASR
jgi:phosphopantetheinyl transferase